MIGYLQGEILEYTEGQILLGIGDKNTSGLVGYLVSTPQNLASHEFRTGQKIELFIYTHIREEAFDLYGFVSPSEKALFLTLLSVNGIGPKSALAMLSGVESSQLIQAIIHGDKAFLTLIPGIGKKTAERMVVELQDVMKKKIESGVFDVKSSSTLTVRKGENSQGGSPAEILISDVQLHSPIYQDAKAALVHLGYREQDVHQLLSKVLKNAQNVPRKAEDLIRIALKQLV